MFNFINYVLVTSQQGQAIQSYTRKPTNNQILFETFSARVEIRNTYRTCGNGRILRWCYTLILEKHTLLEKFQNLFYLQIL